MIKGTLKISGIVLIICIAATACEKMLPQAPESNEVLAEPIGTLTQSQLALHIRGDEEFARVFGEADGLGPIFVQNSCESCHPGDGKGNPVNTLVRFGKYRSDGTWDPMLSSGGPQLQHRSIRGTDPEKVPSEARSSGFIAPNVTGLGYLEAVEDQTILDIAQKQAEKGLVSGVPNYITPPDFFVPAYHHQPNSGKYIGRFGRKAAAINLTHQVTGAYKQDMGITSDYDAKDPVNYAVSLFAGDDVADPEIPGSTVDAVAFYIETLEAPRRRNEDDPDVITGEQVFIETGCAECHQKTLKTGKSQVTALNRVEFYPYTDMLMHDMGSELDDSYTEGEAETFEWRTTPLWGLGLQKDSQGGKMYLMHDGRANTYDQAVQLHGGEAAFSRTNYNKLSSTQKEQLEKFLDSL